jgi:hypothetical protein
MGAVINGMLLCGLISIPIGHACGQETRKPDQVKPNPVKTVPIKPQRQNLFLHGGSFASPAPAAWRPIKASPNEPPFAFKPANVLPIKPWPLELPEQPPHDAWPKLPSTDVVDVPL